MLAGSHGPSYIPKVQSFSRTKDISKNTNEAEQEVYYDDYTKHRTSLGLNPKTPGTYFKLFYPLLVQRSLKISSVLL